MPRWPRSASTSKPLVGLVMAWRVSGVSTVEEVSIPLESSTAHGGGIDIDVLAAMRQAVPNATLYYWGSREARFDGVKVPAKVAVADRRLCVGVGRQSEGFAAEKSREKNMAAGA